MEASYLTSSGLSVESLPQVGRRLRRPTHNFAVSFLPFTIQPFMIAPVLPGDTMKNLLMQARVVSDAVKNPLIGWWHEAYFFYVKLRDLDDRAALENMLLTNGAPPAPEAANLNHYYKGEGVNYVGKALKRIVDTYFRSEEEVQDAVTMTAPRVLGGMPLAKVTTMPGWMESLKADSDTPHSDGTALPGDLDGLAGPQIPPQYVGTIFEAAWTQWKQMQHLELVPPTFEDYLKTFGVRAPKAEQVDPHNPELIRYVRNWKQPSNTVGETGAINSQLVWDVAERADKDRFFAEPGFIFGVMTARAKVYSGIQEAAMSSYLNDAFTWLPALLQPDPFTSLKKFAFGGTGPLGNQTEDYWVDLADLLVGGDQFTNYASTDTTINLVGRPNETGASIDINKWYLSQADIDGLFVNAAGGKNLVRSEGRVDLTILSRIQDTTP